ncbi:glycosyltransferase [Pedobacter agri]|uniref:glycosyltransferase n=1 Tax=Pedobacter agri TaxID=454586 RepID=UPI00292DDF1F|nr:glycosyltransferase [Pedobacter agri]
MGGTERIVQYLIEELVLDGHEVTLMAHNDSIVQKEVTFIPIGTYLDQKNTIRLIWSHLLLNKYDVIHNHGRLIHFLPTIWSNTKKIHTFHMAELLTRSFLSFLKMRPVNLTLSPCGKWIEEKFKYLSADWKYVNNGLPIDKYDFTTNPDFNSEIAPLTIICRIGPGKGIQDAIDIATKTGKKLVIAGKIGDYPHEIKWFNDNVGIHCDNDKIKFIGEINDVEKNTLLNNSLALIIPTKDSEAFNTTMIEANACGCPVISYNKYCFPEFIKQGVNGFTADNKSDLIDKINLLKNIDRRACREIFEKYYTAKIMTENYLKIYRN